MPKQTLIEAKILDKILNFFGGSSDTSSKQKFLGTIQKSDPSVAKAFDNWENDFSNLLQATRKVYVKNGRSTKEIDDLIRRSK
jgi:hypothetical protein